MRSASSYMSQNDMRLHFGLGQATKVDAIEVRWPGKERGIERLGPQAADQFLTVRQGSGVVRRAPPSGQRPISPGSKATESTTRSASTPAGTPERP